MQTNLNLQQNQQCILYQLQKRRQKTDLLLLVFLTLQFPTVLCHFLTAEASLHFHNLKSEKLNLGAASQWTETALTAFVSNYSLFLHVNNHRGFLGEENERRSSSSFIKDENKSIFKCSIWKEVERNLVIKIISVCSLPDSFKAWKWKSSGTQIRIRKATKST